MAHLLIVEDDELLRDGLSAQLTQAGHRITTAEDGEAALARLSAEAFDGVVLDLGLPKIDGLSVLRQLRQRITFQYVLKPLSNTEFEYYILHRLATAGCQRGQLFTKPALWWLRRKSRRIPRLINILANKSLMAAYGRGKRMVGLREVMRAVRDTESVRREGRERLWLWTMLLALVAGLALAIANGEGLL